MTPAGQDLYDVIVRLGEWSHRWFNPLLDFDDLDPQLLLWDIHRRLVTERLPDARTVVEFAFTGAYSTRHWLILEDKTASVCWEYPGFDADLIVTADTLTLHRVWMGHEEFAQALRKGSITLEGLSNLTRTFEGWLALSQFAKPAPRPAVVP